MTEVPRRTFLGRAGLAAGAIAAGTASLGLLAGCTDFRRHAERRPARTGSRSSGLRVAARTKDQATQLKDGLAELDGVRVVTPTDPGLSAGIVCMEVEDVEAAIQAIATVR